EVNVYAAPHRFQWLDIDPQLTTWSSWASLVLEDTDLTDETLRQESSDLSIQDLPKIIRPLRELQTRAAQLIIDYIETDLTAGLDMLLELDTLETAEAVDTLRTAVRFAGPSADFLEAATELLHEVDPTVPKIYRTSVSALAHELSSLVMHSDASPGEQFMVLQEALEALGWGLFLRDGTELPANKLADLAQQVIALNPVETSWSYALQTAFRDWRAGRLDISPDDVSHEPLPPAESETQGEEPQQPYNIPATLDELAQKLTFVTDDSKDWLRTTRDLLLRKRQLILQGPPGTGKT